LWSRYMQAAIEIRPKTGCVIEVKPASTSVQQPVVVQQGNGIPALDDNGNAVPDTVISPSSN